MNVVGIILKMFPQDSCRLVVKSNTHVGTAVKELRVMLVIS